MYIGNGTSRLWLFVIGDCALTCYKGKAIKSGTKEKKMEILAGLV